LSRIKSFWWRCARPWPLMYAWYLLQSCLCEITLPKKQISLNILPGSASIGSGPPVKKRMPSAAWSLLALPREELELARLLGTWCWSPRTADLMPSQSLHLFGVIAIAYIYNIFYYKPISTLFI
jgi:hypothetical protein